MKTVIKTYVPFIAIGLLLACLSFRLKHKPSCHRRMALSGSNTAEGQNALSAAPPAHSTQQLVVSLESGTAGDYNTGLGAATLVLNTQVKILPLALCALKQYYRLRKHSRWRICPLSNATGFRNAATGRFALFNNTTAALTQPRC